MKIMASSPLVTNSKINCKTKNSLSMYAGKPDTSCKSKNRQGQKLPWIR